MSSQATWAIALHGGAGVEPGRDYSRAIQHLDELVRRCVLRLEAGATALDVVEEAVAEMEASGLYVAGRGSAASTSGHVEVDASIMDGARRRAGAVAAVPGVVHPIRLARAVMDTTAHVMLTGEGALAFAKTHGHALVADPASYYVLPPGVEEADLVDAARNHGTVGAVALDQGGRLAAATSTGGLFGKLAGRVGDTPLIGAGTWADETVAVSCTGTGEYFILAGGAQDVASRMRYLASPVQAAVDGLIGDVARLGGDGGVIAVTKTGEIAFGCNTPGMKRAAASSRLAPFASL
ncbi:MAG: isoaspartyl peptidase/L-asparaginase family protein [Caulobacterales bacterium]